MRILKVTGAYPPAFAHGGSATAAHSLAKSLGALGHDVSVLTTDINGGARLQVPGGWTTWEGVRVKYCRWTRCPLPYYSLELAQEIRRTADRYDVVLLDSGWTAYGLSVARECNRRNVPYVIYSHGSHSPASLLKSRLQKKVWWWALDKALYNAARAAVALTSAEADYLRSLGVRIPIERIPNGVNIDSLSEAESRDNLDRLFPRLRGRRIVLFLGRLEPIKGIDILIPAMAEVRTRFQDAVLVLAGPSDRGYHSVVERLLAACHLEPNVVMTGLVTGATKMGLLRAAELFALSSYGEGLSMSTLEAMAAGVPVVITRSCDLPEVEEAGAGLVTELRAAEVASAIGRLLGDPGLRQQMGRNGARLVSQQFTWEQVARKTAALCRSVLANY